MKTAERLRHGSPLAGQTVIVTRPRALAWELSSRLRALGARVIEAPTIRIQDPPDRRPLLEALRHIRDYRWVVFTSVNGVRKVRQGLGELGMGSEDVRGPRVAAIGPATAREATRAGLRPVVIPRRYRAEALVEAIREAASAEGAAPSSPGGPGPLAGARILLPRAAEARDVLPAELRAAGARVEEVTAYVTLPAPEGSDELRRALEQEEADWITFTSSSTVRHFVELAGGRTGRARVAAIGPITATTARELGLRVDVVASEYTIPGLVQALAEAGRGGET